MHIWFRRVGQTEYVDVVAEDRTPSEESPRAFLSTKKTFKGVNGLLDAAEKAAVNEQGLLDLHAFAQRNMKTSEGASGNLSLSREELDQMGFPPPESTMREYLVSIVPESSTANQITVQAKLRNQPPGMLQNKLERPFTQAELSEVLKIIDRKLSDLFNPQMGIDVPKKARFDAEDAHTLFTWRNL